jgi:hypothetical protein
MKLHVSREAKEQTIPDMNKSQKPVSPVPQWLIALPLICAVVAAILVVSGQPGPLTLAIFFISLFVLGYLYFYLVGIWIRHRSKNEA